jgi:hypothetical protein
MKLIFEETSLMQHAGRNAIFFVWSSPSGIQLAPREFLKFRILIAISASIQLV